MRFERTGSMDDLDGAIVTYKKAESPLTFVANVLSGSATWEALCRAASSGWD